jgi:hypothetical protein
MDTRPCASQLDRDALEDLQLRGVLERTDEPVLLHHEERTAS